MTDLYIDYNAETEDGRFFARLSRVDDSLSVGQKVETHDEDGNRLVVAVDELDMSRGVAYFKPDWSTWSAAGVGLRFAEHRAVWIAHAQIPGSADRWRSRESLDRLWVQHIRTQEEAEPPPLFPALT